MMLVSTLIFMVLYASANGQELQCRSSELRLQGGNSSFEGRVELCFDGTWRTVCDDGWNATDARVVCRQLGLPDNAIALGNASFGQGFGGGIFVNCSGGESRLIDCHANPRGGTCVYAGVRCLEAITTSSLPYETSPVLSTAAPSPPPLTEAPPPSSPPTTRTPATACSTGDIRLQGGRSDFEGHVEICVNGTWGSVCGGRWDQLDAMVVCRQLGYNDINATSLQRLGPETGIVWLDDVSCLGNERRLIDCRAYLMRQHTCGEIGHADVRCLGTTSSPIPPTVLPTPPFHQVEVMITPSKPLSVLIGDFISLTCSPNSSSIENFTFMWYHINSSAILPETSDTLTLTRISPAQLGIYACVTNSTSSAGAAFVTLESARPVIRGGGYPAKRSSSSCPSEDVQEDIMVDVLQFLAAESGVHPLGLSRSYAAESCAQVIRANPDAKSGLYWIKNSESATRMHCEF